MSIVKLNFDTKIAKQLGTDAAIIYSNIEFWIMTNKANKQNFYDDNFWMYHSIKAFCELFDWLTESQIKTCLLKLEKANFIVVGNYNKVGYDRTKWYSIPLNSTISENSQMDLSNIANRFAKNRQPIQDNKTDIKKDIKEQRLFFDSIWNNYETLKNHFANSDVLKSKYAYCDLKYYIQKVDTWSENSQKKRTDRGWLMTLIDFIDQAKSKGEMRTIEKPTTQRGHTNY